MRKSERAFFLEVLRPYLREGERLFESGTTLVYETKDDPSISWNVNRWYLDRPSSLGSTESRQIGQVEQAPGWKEGLVCWNSKSPRFTGKGWENRMLAEFLRLTGLDTREPIPWTEKESPPCGSCGQARRFLNE